MVLGRDKIEPPLRLFTYSTYLDDCTLNIPVSSTSLFLGSCGVWGTRKDITYCSLRSCGVWGTEKDITYRSLGSCGVWGTETVFP